VSRGIGTVRGARRAARRGRLGPPAATWPRVACMSHGPTRRRCSRPGQQSPPPTEECTMALSKWWKKLARRGSHSSRQDRFPFRPRQWWRLALERLEDRLAPANSPLAYTIPAAGPHAVTLQLSGTDLQIVESSNTSNVLAHQAASTTSEVDVTGTTTGDAFTIDVNSFTTGAATLTVSSPAAGKNQVAATGLATFVPVVFTSLTTVSVDAHSATGADSVTVDSSGLVATGLKNFNVTTGSGNDTFADNAASFALPVGGGAFTVTTGAGSDTLDFTGFGAAGLPLTVSADKTQFTAQDGSVLTQGGAVAEHVDVNFASGAKGAIDSVLDDLSTLSGKLQSGASALAALAKQLPLLSQTAQGSAAQLLDFANKIDAFKTNAENTISGLASNAKLSTIVSDLSGLSLPSGFGTITFTSDYRRAPADTASSTTGDLEGLIAIHLEASASTSLPLDLGAGAQDVGLAISGSINVGTTLTANLTVGLTTDTAPHAFLVPSASPTDGLNVGVHASVSGLSAALKLGFLSASISGGSIDFAGTVHVGLADPDSGSEITLTELTNNLSTPSNLVSTSVQSPSFAATLPVTVGAGVTVGGSDLNLLSATLSLGMANAADIFNGGVPTFSLWAGSHPATALTLSATTGMGITITGASDTPFAGSDVGHQVIFQGGSAVITAFTDPTHVTANVLTAFSSTTISSGSWLLGSVNLLDFSNVSPTEVMGMLGSVFNTFVSLAGTSALKTPIPFTGKTVGDLLDYATAFKTKVLDPLFVSGNALRPDNDGDGTPDFTFGNIQELVNDLKASLGMGGPLAAAYDPSSKQLSFTIDFNRALGFGQATVAETQHGDATHDEIQTVAVNAIATGGTLTDTFKLAFPDSHGVLQFTSAIPYNAAASVVHDALAGPGGIVSTSAGDVTVNKSGSTYTIEFTAGKGNQALPVLVSDATQLAGAFPLDFGASLGDFASVKTTGSFSLAATLDAGLTFGIDLHPSENLQITPPVYSPSTDVTVTLPDNATANSVQIVTVHGANGGNFILAYNNNPSAAISFNAPPTGAGSVQAALQAVSGITSVNVTEANSGVDRVYTVTFTNPSQPTALLVPNSAGLVGTADNALLAAADGTVGSANAHFSAELFNKAISVADGTHTAQTIAPQSLGSIDVLVPPQVMATSLSLSATSGNNVTATAGSNVFHDSDVGQQILAGPGLAVITTFTDGMHVTVSVIDNFASTSFAATGWHLGRPLDALAADTQTQVNTDLVNAGLTLGFLHAGQLSTGPLTTGGSAIGTGNPFAHMANDVGFTLNLTGSHTQSITGTLRAVDVLDPNATVTARTLFNMDGTLDLTKLGTTVNDVGHLPTLASRLQDAITSALSLAGVSGFTIAVGTSGTQLTFSVSAVPTPGDTIELAFTTPLEVDAGGGRLSLSTPPVQFSAQALAQAVNVDRDAQVTANFNDTAYQDMGLLSAPTRFDGTTSNTIDVTLVVNGANVHVTLPAQTTNTNIGQLVSALQSAVDTQLAATVNPESSSSAHFAAGDVTVFLVDSDPAVKLSATPTTIALTAPANGQLAHDAVFILSDGSVQTMGWLAAADTTGFSSHAQLQTALQTAVNDALTRLQNDGGMSGTLTVSIDASGAVSLTGTSGFTIQVSPAGNRIGFQGRNGVVDKLALNVPYLGGANGAVTDLGYNVGNGPTQRSKATAFFLDNVHLTGQLALIATNVSATATLGFLSVTATGSGTLGSDKFIDASADFSLKNPLDGTSRLTPDVLIGAFKHSQFFFDAAHEGGTADNPSTGIVSGAVSGGVGVDLTIAPSGALSGLASTLNAHAALSATSPNWLLAPPSISDPLGFGTDAQALSTSTFTLSQSLPSNGQLTQNVSFVISDGTHSALGLVRAADTASFTTTSQLLTALQGAVNDALARLHAAGSSSTTTITVGNDGGKLSLTASAADLTVRGNVIKLDFNGPDFNNILDHFRHLSFSDIIGALKLLTGFLQSLEGTGGAGNAIAGALAFRLPLVNRSISDLIDMASSLSDKLDAIAANPSGSVQQLDTMLHSLLGIAGSTPILSLDTSTPSDPVLDIDFDFGAGTELSQPFNLDLSQVPGIPSFITNLVGASASGNLDLKANATFHLALGLDLAGANKGFFLRTGSSGTSLDASASASGNNLDFDAKLGPFGLFVTNGSGSLAGDINVHLLDPHSNGRLVLVGWNGSSVTSDLANLSNFVGADSITVTGTGAAKLPLFIGTNDFKVPLDFAGANPGQHNSLIVGVDLVKLITGKYPDHTAAGPGFDPIAGLDPPGIDETTGSPFIFTPPDFNFNSLPIPGIFTLLSDPSVVVDGLDHLLGTLQDALSGQIFGVKLPFLGNVLANNPAANALGDIRDHLLKPLANTLRENNANLDTLVSVIEMSIFDVLQPLGVLQHHDNMGHIIPDDNMDATAQDVLFTFFDANGHATNNVFIAHAAQFDLDIGKDLTIPLSDPIAFDLGIPALNLSAMFQPTITLHFHVHLGFGVDQTQGFYFVTNHTVPEMSASIDVFLADPMGPPATLHGNLLFLNLALTDGAAGARSSVHLGGDVILDDPNHDGRLTFAELTSSALSDIIKPSLTGTADFRAHGVVGFGGSLGSVLPSISTDLFVHLGLHIAPGSGFTLDPPAVALANISLDLGSFISSFAAPILDRVKQILDPLAWLIGPDGFLNKRIPLLSDLAGHTITGKDLVILFDPDDGPKIVAFLDFVQELYFLANLVDTASHDGDVNLNFGDLILTGDSYFQSTAFSPDFASIFDHPIDLGGFNGITDLSKQSNLDNFSLPDPSTLPTPSFDSPPASASSTFTSGVQKPGGIDFAILKPATIFKLLMGQPDVTLVTVTLPEFGFNFFYRQSFPIFGPLVATFGGGIGATIDLTFGYDTHGLQEFLKDKNAADLIDGFFIQAIDPATGQRVPQITFNAEIAVGAALDLGIAKAGVEGGIDATIKFFLDDLNNDGKVRLSEMAANLLYNGGNPLAVFDISGEIDFFLRAFLEIDLGFVTIHKDFEFARLKLVEFDITFNRPAILGVVSNGTLTLNIGPSAGARLHGDTSDGNEEIHAKTDGGNIVVWGFGINEGDAHFSGINEFPISGVTKIVANGGAGDDLIDLSGVTGIPVEVHGGDGNDTIIGGGGNDSLYGDAGNDVIIGNGGNDSIDGGSGNDFLFGDGLPGTLPGGFSPPTFTTSGSDGEDTIEGGDGNDYLYGGGGADKLMGGSGDDTYARSAGGDTYVLADFGSVDHITGTGVGNDVLDFTGKAVNLTYFLHSDSIDVGFNQTPGTAGTSIGDFASQLIVDDPTDITSILGGDGVDTFNVYSTTAAGLTLNGQKGNDQYIFHLDNTDPVITATVTDTGNAWDSTNAIQVVGTDSTDNVRVTNADLTLDNGGAKHEVVTYTSPASDENVLQIKVNGNGGDDQVTVASTSQTVPVRVDGGAGNDVITVGEGTVSGIQGWDRPGLNAPMGLGPLVLVGGTGHDVVVINDSGDSNARSGNLTAFLEKRNGVANPVEVGVVSGLGMTLSNSNGSSDDRVEFEGFEAVDVKLGTKADQFTVGGGINFDKTSATGGQFEADTGVNTAFPKNRLADDVNNGNSLGIKAVVNTIAGLTIVEGGGGKDTVGVIATQQLDRGTLDGNLGLFTHVVIQNGSPSQNEVQTITVHNGNKAHGTGYFTIGYRYEETAPIAIGASDADVAAALLRLPLIGFDAHNNPNVAVVKNTMNGDDLYTITFQNGKADQDIPVELLPAVAPLVIDTGADDDTLNVQSIQETTFFLGGTGEDLVQLNVSIATGLPQTTNGVNAHVTLDGQGGSDTYDVHLVGGTTASLVNVFDSGNGDHDVLTVTGTDLPDIFLLRASSSQQGLAFIALLNHDAGKAPADQPVERVNYDVNLESITINSLGGDDQFYIDDTRAEVTINGGDGNDFFQIGQLYQTPRFTDPTTGIIDGDTYATIETTKGWLSNGVSFPITINGDAGEDLFIVFHNKAVATLNGGADDDTFIVQAFALAGSTEDHRALTDLSGGAGADFIQYAVDAPVEINGGDGFDTVVIIGTEFGDDFVVTPTGVFGAGLSVNFINIELLQIDGAEGDDRFFVLGTAPNVVTEISGGLGTDLFSINGPTPANGVISNDLLGHSGILTHAVSSADPNYDGLKVVGISANVADNDEPAIIVTPTDGASLVVQGDTTGMTLTQAQDAHLVDSYSIVLSRPPVNGTEVDIDVEPPPGLVFVDDALTEIRNSLTQVALGKTLTFNAMHPWYVPQIVHFKVDSTLVDIPDLADIQHKVTASLLGISKSDITGNATGGGNGTPVTVSTTTGGDPGHNEVQQVTVAHTSGFGYFTLTYRDEETDPIAFGAPASDVAAALAVLPLIGHNAMNQPNVAVTGPAGGPYVVTFQNDLGNQDVPQLTGREESTLVDTALSAAEGPGGSDGLPEGLRGATVTIADCFSHPELAGQSRLVLFQSADGHTLILNKPWLINGATDLPNDVSYQINMFAGLSIPNVRAQVFSNQKPAIVVYQTGGSTSVAEISTSTAAADIDTEKTNGQVDEVDVRLSSAPSADVTVTLDGSGQLEFFDGDNPAHPQIHSLTFTAAAGPNSWDTFRHILVRGIDDHLVEGFHKADLTFTASGGNYANISNLITADIADNDSPGVRVIESNGSTNVIEYTSGAFGTTATQVDNVGFPRIDSYQLVLTSQPTADVIVNVVSNPTRTSRTGGIRSFVEQLEVSTDGINWHAGDTGDPLPVTFTHDNWYLPQTIYVRAKDNNFVDGTDTKVFAPGLDQVNDIQGPLFINGGSSADHTGLTERQAIILPYEIDEKTAMGHVEAAQEATGVQPATITIDPTEITQADIDTLNGEANASVHITGPLTDPNQLRNVSLQVTHGPGKGKVRIISGGSALDAHHWVLTLGHEWFSPFPAPGNSEVPDATSKYVLLQTNPNLLVTEADQTDILQVHDTDNVNSFDDLALPPGGVNNYAVGQLFYDNSLFGPKATVSTEVNGGPTPNNGPINDEVQKLTLTATSGSFTLIFAGHVTDPIPFNATEGQVQTALQNLSNIGMGNVVVHKDPVDPVYTITFQNALGHSDQPQLHADSTNLTGGTALNSFRITGLGMGGSGPNFARTVGTGTDARSEPGGLTLTDIEDLEIDLGPGDNHFTIGNTPAGTKTTLNTGAGNDLVDVQAISGHTFVNLGAGTDTINVTSAGVTPHTLATMNGLLTVSGDVPQVTVTPLANGSPAQGGLIQPVNAIQQVTVDATGGTFTLSVTDPATQTTATTPALDWNAAASVVQDKLGHLSTVGVGNVLVSKAGNVYRVTFVNGKGAQAVPLMAEDDSGLINGLGAKDTLNVDDSATTAPTVGVLTSSSLTGLGLPQVNEIQTLVVDATQGHFRLSYGAAMTGSLSFDISAAALQAALAGPGGIVSSNAGDVAVTKNGTVYVIRFQGNLTNTNVLQLGAASIDLMKRVEPSGGDPNATPSATTATAGDPTLVNGTATVTTRVQGTNNPLLNDEQVVTVKATAGTFTLTLLHGTAQQFTTLPIPFDASAEFVRQTIQNAAAAAIAPGDTFEPQKFDVTVDRYGTVYVIGFQGKLRQVNNGPGVDLLQVTGDAAFNASGGATVATRMDGINYYGVEVLNISTGTGNNILNVQGTSAGSRGFAQGGTLNNITYAPGVAQVFVHMHQGNEQVFVSSNADLDANSAPGFDFLTGNLGDVRGALNLDFGTGSHRLLISDEADTVGATNARIVDDMPAAAATAAGLDTNAEIWVTGLAPAGISYKADRTSTGGVPNGDFFGGIIYWTGSGDDTIYIDGTANRSGSGKRTMTLLNTGLGNDNVTVALNGALNQPTGDTGQDGFFALNTMGGSFSPNPTTGAVTDNDTVDASASTLPLVIFGGLGNDSIQGGSNNDVIFGDDGRVQYADPSNPGALLAVVGFGGRGDMISSRILQPTWAFSRDLTLGGQDTILGNGGEDLLVGGANNDTVDGGTGDDLIFGDAVKLARRPTDITNARFEALSGTQIYDTSPSNSAGGVLTDGVARNYRDPDGSYAPSWANWQIHNLYHTLAIQTANDNSFGNDYIAGGAGNDVIFGQLGNDVIQGDGSVNIALTGSQLVGAHRDASNNLVINPSFEAATDGDDYIEGGGGSDVIFGGLGQDDIIGGSSDLYTLTTAAMRPDGSDLIFGGAGTHIGRNDAGTLSGVPTNQLHARDSDAIVGDNGDIFRIVGINHPAAGQAATGFLTFNYDLTSTAEDRGSLRIIPRAAKLLDYTPGGPDFNAAAAANDLGAADEIHGESGDDFIYGEKGNDVLFGDGQNDVIVGGYGADWISGGTGDDGILGDDGRIFVSRNSSSFGEPLYGIAAIPAANINQLDASSDGVNNAVLNVNLALKYTVDLTPQNLQPNQATPPDPLFRPLYANDIIYGGLGNDAIHGGAGDDAISGAEAPVVSFTNNYDQNGTRIASHQESDFAHPFNPGNVLGYSPTTTKFDLYDANDPLRKILLTATGALSKTGSGDNWILNFDQTEGPVDTFWIQGQSKYAGVATDGDDHIFGDLGNDWAVGGTGRDVLYGGWGDDLLNADDNLNSNGGLNNVADTNPSYEDLAFGGAGRDVLIGNTNGDRLMDWVGEFNTMLVPYAQFGAVSVSRLLQPTEAQFLYDLSKSDGADQTLAAQYSSDPARNGEPFGELGLVLQQDAAWQAQTGGPRDPQAGNIGGGQVDVKNNPGTSGTKPIYETADAPAAATGSAEFLTDAQLAPVVAQARALWVQALGAGDSHLAALDGARVAVGNLPEERLGVTIGQQVLIDSTAAGYGWFVSGTPEALAASGRMDLLTVVAHELGNVMGFPEDSLATSAVTSPLLSEGARHLPGGVATTSEDVGATTASASTPAGSAFVSLLGGPESAVPAPALTAPSVAEGADLAPAALTDLGLLAPPGGPGVVAFTVAAVPVSGALGGQPAVPVPQAGRDRASVLVGEQALGQTVLGGRLNLLLDGIGQVARNGTGQGKGTFQFSEDLDTLFSLPETWTTGELLPQRQSDAQAGMMESLFPGDGPQTFEGAAVDYLFGNQGRDWLATCVLDQGDQEGSETGS
jgi:Ca2+-binding RTX toxin-like protein